MWNCQEITKKKKRGRKEGRKAKECKMIVIWSEGSGKGKKRGRNKKESEEQIKGIKIKRKYTKKSQFAVKWISK
jgi:hypothetical protein